MEGRDPTIASLHNNTIPSLLRRIPVSRSTTHDLSVVQGQGFEMEKLSLRSSLYGDHL
jgi:hypothetical protein